MTNVNEQVDPAASGGQMSAVKLTPFWHRSSAFWFHTVEALFVLKGVMENVKH
jgi:hypothetical protein